MRAILLVAVVTVATIACAPARELDLFGTSWLVTHVGDTAIPSEDRGTITFGFGQVFVELSCGVITDDLYMDTDGAAMDLLGDADVEEACGGQTTPVERIQLEALRDVSEWRINTNEHIVLVGGPDVVLERVSRE